MAEHPIQGLMNVTMEKIHQMVDSNTIIGKPIITEDGTTILPVSKVSFGFASGGTDFDGKNAANKDLFGGGSGAGVNIQPVAFLVVKDGCVRTIQLSDNADTINRALTMLPELPASIAVVTALGIQVHSVEMPILVSGHRCAWASIRPGVTMCPAASRTRSLSAF